MSSVEAVLSFWFDETSPEQWYGKDSAFDGLIVHRFSGLHAQAVAGELWAWRDTAKGRLAELIVLDQFSRNMFRNTPEAFAADGMALALAQEAVRSGADRELTQTQAAFLYMPYMHSESLVVHGEALRLFTALGSESSLLFEKRHRDIIARFGRYPHRNSILGRQSTPEELDFLRQPGSGF